MPRRAHPAPPTPAAHPVPTAVEVAQRLHAAGLRRSRAREAVIEAFLAAPGHVTLEELTERARRLSPRVGYSTVWRTVQVLVRHGLAAARDFGGRTTRYEAVQARTHHDHLVCTRCGAVEEFEHEEIERLQETVAHEVGFEITAHTLELYGACARCRVTGGRPGPAAGGAGPAPAPPAGGTTPRSRDTRPASAAATGGAATGRRRGSARR